VTFDAAVWNLRTRSLTTADHTLVMGIVNVTPDSFSDGGRWFDPDAAIEQALRLHRSGADIIDIGGESTRPGAGTVDVDEEIRRVVAVVGPLARAGVVVSVDTRKPAVAEAAIASGAEAINDVGGLATPAMADVCAAGGVGVVIMHMQGEPATMQDAPTYRNVVDDVTAFLDRRATAAVAAGVDPRRIVVDPGIGFGKTFEHNLALLNGIGRIGGGRPVLIGTSRKGFLATILERAGLPSGPEERDVATAASVAISIARGAAIVRVHDVAGSVSAARTADAMVRER